ncbi:MAG: hypothetical protein OJF61_001559 [Rhodanobacteraceae bacterium]|jgi:hypothetical protein|nr:MAG: hypothetical protein OJF61_001559 [Rhodanobacteraceae bacterium]
MGRAARLRRQFSEIEQRSLELPRSYREQLAELIGRECNNVEAAADPSTYGTQTENGVTTNGLDLGFDRARSDNVQVRMRGIALWIALVYRETRNAEAPESQELHRAILRVMRELKVFSSRAEGSGNPS